MCFFNAFLDTFKAETERETICSIEIIITNYIFTVDDLYNNIIILVILWLKEASTNIRSPYI